MTTSYAASGKKRGKRPVKEALVIPYARELGVVVSSTQDLINELEEGFSYEAVEQLQEQLGASLSELSDLLQIPRRTLSRRKREGKLPPDESERLLRFSRILYTSVELFEGDRELALPEIESPNSIRKRVANSRTEKR